MRLFLIPVLFFLFSYASTRDLREEFTWTRIEYELNGSYRSNRNNDQRSGRRTIRASDDEEKVELEHRYGFSDIKKPGPKNHYGNRNDEDDSNYSNRELRGQTGNRGQSGNRGQGGNRGQNGRYQGNNRNQNSGNQGGFNQDENQNNNQNQGSNQNQISTNLNDPNAQYIYQNNIPMGASPWRNKLFVTVPRRRYGVPSSLNFVHLNNNQRHNVPLIPYPNLEINTLPSGWQNVQSNGCSSSTSNNNNFTNRIISVYRVAVDPCDRLWMVDTGRIEIPGAPIQVAPPKLVIIDLNSDQIIQSHIFPDSVVTSGSLLAHIVVDVTTDSCRNAYAYMADVAGYGLVVYSLRENRSWRITHNFFYLEPLAGEFTISGHTFQWNDGVFSTALSAPNNRGHRDLYFHSMAGTHLYSVPTEVLRNETISTRSYHGNDFKVVGDRGQFSQTSASALHEDSGVLFFGLVNQNALGCWNINNKPVRVSIVQKDDQRMIYPCDLKVYNENVYLLTNTMPEFLYGQLNYDQTNFRIWVQSVREAVSGTPCAGGRRGY